MTMQKRRDKSQGTFRVNRRRFLATAAPGALLVSRMLKQVAAETTAESVVLPKGSAPQALEFAHFPSRLHAVVWRNWALVPAETIAKAIGTTRDNIVDLGHSIGLQGPPEISNDQIRRSKITVIRANWHLLPYEQLLVLLNMTASELAFMLREDDFLYVKLGNLKPSCAPVKFEEPTAAIRDRAAQIKRLAESEFSALTSESREPLFGFLKNFPKSPQLIPAPKTAVSPRFCYSYFALYGDPLLEPDLDPYPDDYLANLAASGVDSVWLQGILKNLAPYPFAPKESEKFPQRIANLQKLVAHLKKHGMRLFLYLNEPRSLPLSAFLTQKSIQGVVEGDYAAVCTSVPAVRDYLKNAIASICKAVPDLGGFFTISASENLTNCWSHGNGSGCPRCTKRSRAEVIAELHHAFYEGIIAAKSNAQLIAWDWGWPDNEVAQTIQLLPREVSFMAVSEWEMPIERGGVKSTVGEYSISAVGPGERAKKNWKLARTRGLKTLAKIQAGNTWELASVPYIPAIANVARHAANLREADIQGVMLGWTLGGFPSPNLEVVSAILNDHALSPAAAMVQIAEKRFGKTAAQHVVSAWEEFSNAFSDFPYSGGVVYTAPLQMGPANLLWTKKTGYKATMVGLPYDDFASWRNIYPEAIFIQQMELVANRWLAAFGRLKANLEKNSAGLDNSRKAALKGELTVAETAGIHFKSVANQARFVHLRDRSDGQSSASVQELEDLIKEELSLARRLHLIQSGDSRIGFEASNQYFYTPNDLVEKVLNCEFLLANWIPALRTSAK